MSIVFGISLLILGFAVFNYPNWSYKEFEKRSKVNAKHPKWEPYCGVNFLKEDPQWFIDNGYADYVY